MKTLSCASMGMADCPFVAQGETDKEVMNAMMSHVKVEHPDMAKGLSNAAMRANIKEA